METSYATPSGLFAVVFTGPSTPRYNAATRESQDEGFFLLSSTAHVRSLRREPGRCGGLIPTPAAEFLSPTLKFK